MPYINGDGDGDGSDPIRWDTQSVSATQSQSLSPAQTTASQKAYIQRRQKEENRRSPRLHVQDAKRQKLNRPKLSIVAHYGKTAMNNK